MGKMDNIFARHGKPEVVKTDNGPPFNGEIFTRWLKNIGSKHRKITPHWPQANCEVERLMKSIGKIVRSAKLERSSSKQVLYRFLRHYRATPHSTTGKSPAEMLFGRKIRTEIPSVVESHCNSEEYHEEVGKKDDSQKRKMKIYADEKRGAKDVQLDIDDLVLVKQNPLNKSETAFNPLPYQVTDIKGTMVTAENKVIKSQGIAPI